MLESFQLATFNLSEETRFDLNRVRPGQAMIGLLRIKEGEKRRR